MKSTIGAVSGLLMSVGVMLLGNGLLSTLLVLKASVSYSDFVIGVMMSMYFVGAILGTLYMPVLIRRIGHIRTYAIMASVAACTVLLHGMLLDPYLWAVLRMIMGLATVGIYMVIESWLNDVAPHQHRGRVLAIYMMVTLVALAAGQFLVLMDSAGAGIAFMLAAALVAISLVPIAATGLTEPKPLHTARLGIKHLMQRSPLGMISVLCSGMGTSIFWSLGPLYAKQFGIALAVPIFMSSTIMGGFMLQWPIGLASDRWGRPKVLVVVSLLSALTAAAIVSIPALGLTSLYVLMFFLGGYMFSIYPLSVALTNDCLTREELVDASGNLLLVQGIGAVASPIVAGAFMAAYGVDTLFLHLLCIMLVLGLLAAFYSRKGVEVVDESSSFVPMTRTSQVAFEIIEAEAEPQG